MTKTLNKIKNLFIILIITFLLIEILSFFLTYMKILKFYNVPTYSFDKKDNWLSTDKDFGVWHKKNFSFTSKTACYKVTYKSNDIGARSQFDYLKLENDNNVFIIGDSFVEGYGAHHNEIFSELLTKNTPKKGLNFGSSGHFGPVQYYLVYEKFHKQIPHNELLIFFLPANDFLDNSIRNPLFKTKVYRPYYEKKLEDYKIFYPDGKVPKTKIKKKNLKRFAKHVLINFTYTANTLRTINYLLFYKAKTDEDYNIFQGYFHDNKEEVDASLHYIKKIIDLAGDIKKTMILIPSINDLEKIYVEKLNYKELYWFTNFEEFSKKNKIRLIDLANIKNDHAESKKNFQSLFNKCDKHWNKKGHQFAFSKYIENS